MAMETLRCCWALGVGGVRIFRSVREIGRKFWRFVLERLLEMREMGPSGGANAGVGRDTPIAKPAKTWNTTQSPAASSFGQRAPPGCSVTWLARLHGVQKVAGSNPVTPTDLQNKPFDVYVEGLSYCHRKICDAFIEFNGPAEVFLVPPLMM